MADSTSTSAPICDGRPHVLGDVGAAEAVDRLLGIADDEQPTRKRPESVPVGVVGGVVGSGGEPDRDLELDRVGVLELVEEDAAVAIVQGGPDRGLGCDEPSGEDEEVVELEGAELGSLDGGFEHPATDHDAEHLSAPLANMIQERECLVGQVDLIGSSALPPASKARPSAPLSMRT